MHKLFKGQNFYDLLKVEATADLTELRKSYRHAALRIHPDKGGSNEAFHALALAFEVLSCPSTRILYDQWLKHTQGHTTGAQNLATSCGASKRPAPNSDVEQQALKRQRAPRRPVVSGKSERHASQLNGALQLLRSVLQSMRTSERQAAIVSMSPRIRAELLMHMENHHDVLCDVGPEPADDAQFASKAKPNMRERSASKYEFTKFYSAHGSQRVKYQATIHVKALRLYTREQSSAEAAIEHQIVLVQMKQALNVKSLEHSRFWDNHEEVLRVCESVLQSNGTSENELGLRAWVHIRAPRWLGSRCRISSPATSLASAAQVHARLLRARATSWESFRAEWVRLLKMRKRFSPDEAETFVDIARFATLKEHLGRALKGVQRALDQRSRQRAGTSGGRRRATMAQKTCQPTTPCTE